MEQPVCEADHRILESTTYIHKFCPTSTVNHNECKSQRFSDERVQLPFFRAYLI